MVRFLGLLSFLFCFAASAAVVPSNVPQISGGVLTFAPSSLFHATQNAGGWFTLIGAGSPGNNNYNPLTRNGSAYQVPASTTTQCVDFRMTSNGASTLVQLVADTAAITFGDTALTSGTFESGQNSIAVHVGNTTANAPQDDKTTFNFSASTYAGWQQLSAATNFYISMRCREVSN